MYKERTTKHGDTFFQYVVPKGSDRTNIVRALNEQVLGGHLNNKTETKKADARFYWPGSWSQIKKHCHACAVSKQGIPNRPQLMSIKATRPFELVAFDMIGPITPITNRGSLVLKYSFADSLVLIILNLFMNKASSFNDTSS